MAFELNHTYSRKEISELLGGSTQTYLPFKQGQVTCGCFRVEEKYNPDAPEEVMFGCEVPQPDVEKVAEMVYAQGLRGGAVPIFIYRGDNEWEYVGDYQCIALLRDAALLKQKSAAYPSRRGITGILRFKKV